MSTEPGNSAGATAIGAPSHNLSDQAVLAPKIDPALRHWLSRSPDDENAINETRLAVSEWLHTAFSDQNADWIVTASTAVLNGISIAEVIDVTAHNWTIDPTDELATAVRYSFLWLGALEGNAGAIALLARLVSHSAGLSAADRIPALCSIGNAVALFAADITLDFLEADEDPNRFELYDADDAGHHGQRPLVATYNFDPPGIAAPPEPDTSICATRVGLKAAEDWVHPLFPWMSDATQTLFRSQYLRVIEGSAPYRFPPTLLLGPSGTAKTSFAYALGEATGIPVFYVSAAGKTGSVEIVGTSKSYEQASPSVGVRAMAQFKCRNPIIIVDEVDKFGHSLQNGDPYGALATMIESHTARAYLDDYHQLPIDLSQISWIFTANAIEPLKGPFLDRLEILRIQRPTVEHFPAIYRHALQDIARDAGISEASLPELSPSVVTAIRDSFKTGISLRRVKGAITKSLEIAAQHQTN